MILELCKSLRLTGKESLCIFRIHLSEVPSVKSYEFYNNGGDLSLHNWTALENNYDVVQLNHPHISPDLAPSDL